MLTEKTNDAQAEALKHDAPILQDQYQVIHTERLVLLMHYQILYKQYQALLERCPTKQGQYPDIATFRQTLQDYRQSQQEQRRLIRQFRQTMHKHLIMRWSYESDQNSRIQADRPLIRKNILLGVGNEKDAAFLKESMQQTCAHRVFVVTDSSQVLRLVQNVYIDLLVLDDRLTPLPGIELYHHLHRMKGLETTPAIIMSDFFSPLLQAELAFYNLVVLEKPIKAVAFVKAIDQFLI
jgi:CheY-like chemotaxis protein